MIKSKFKANLFYALCVVFEDTRMHNLKMNPLKYTFGVYVDNYLRFVVHQQVIKMDKKKENAIIKAYTQQHKKELECFIEKKLGVSTQTL